jgi:transcriptional regulator with XRE-family HTH domain
MPRKSKRTVDCQDFYFAIGRRLAHKRKAAKLSQEKVAGMLGMTRTNLCNIEHGICKLYLHHYVRYCLLIGLPFGHILDEMRDDDDDKPRTND